MTDKEKQEYLDRLRDLVNPICDKAQVENDYFSELCKKHNKPLRDLFELKVIPIDNEFLFHTIVNWEVEVERKFKDELDKILQPLYTYTYNPLNK